MNKLQKIQYLLGAALLNWIVLGVVPGFISNYIEQDMVISGAVILGLTASYFFIGWVTNRFTKHARQNLSLVQRENPQPRRGLIVFMSPGPRITPAENAVNAHLTALEHCWVIAGPDRVGQKPTSRENAEALIQKYKNARTPSVTFHLKSLLDEDNPQQSYHLVQSSYEEGKAFGLSERDIIADYTGGTKSMTAGMVLACSTSEERDTEYMKAQQVTTAGTALPSTDALPVVVDLKFGVPK